MWVGPIIGGRRKQSLNSCFSKGNQLIVPIIMMAYILQKTDYRLVSKYKKSVPSEVYIHFFYLSEEIHQENEQELESNGLLRASCSLWVII